MGTTSTATDARRKNTLRLDVPKYSVANITHARVNAILSGPTEKADKRFVSNYASAGNRTRVTSMATMYSATKPLMPIRCPYGCIPDRRVPSRQLIPRDEWLSDGSNHHRH